MAAKSPPAPTAGSWCGSPTRIAFPSACSTKERTRARTRVSAIPASSTIRTELRERPPLRSASSRRRWRVVLRSPVSSPSFSAGALEGEELARRVEGGTARLRRLPDPLDLREREEAGADPAQALGRDALLVHLRPGHEELGLGEGASLLGQPLGAEQPPGEREQFRPCELAARVAVEERRELGAAEPVLRRSRPPILAQVDEVDVLLAVARLQGGHAAGVEAGRSALGEVLEHLAASAGEGAKRPLWDAGDLGHALQRCLPLDAEGTGELEAEVGLVEVAGGEAVG